MSERRSHVKDLTEPTVGFGSTRIIEIGKPFVKPLKRRLNLLNLHVRQPNIRSVFLVEPLFENIRPGGEFLDIPCEMRPSLEAGFLPHSRQEILLSNQL
jgi:hypothetical protein